MWVKIIRFLAEAIGIIISIVIAFGIENWDEEQKKMEKEDFYLQSLYTDLQKDRKELDRRIANYNQKLESLNGLIANLEANNCNFSNVYKIINENLTYNFSYVPFNHTYKALESSGDIKLIRNEQFKILLFELDKSFFNTTLYGDIFLNYTNSEMWAGFLLDKMNYREQSFKTNAFVVESDKQNFYNRAVRLKVLMETYFYNMQGTLKKIEDVLVILETILIENDLKFEVEKMPIEDSISLEQTNEYDELLEAL